MDAHTDGWKKLMNEQRDRKVDKQTHGWTGGYSVRQTDINMDRQTYRWTDRHIDGQTDI